MKKILTKIKISLATLGIALISFSSKTLGDIIETFSYAKRNKPIHEPMQTVYGVPNTISPINPVLNVVQRLTAIAIFIIGIVNFIRIVRTNDKDLKKKRIRKTIVILSVLIILITCISIVARFLNN